MIFINCKRGTPQSLHAAGWRIVGGMEGYTFLLDGIRLPISGAEGIGK